MDILKKNLLAHGAFRVGDKLVNLKSIGCPLLNVVAEFDAVVHPRSSLPLIDFAAGEDKSNLTFPTGHLGIAASSEAHAKLWPEIASWLKKIGLPSSGGGHLKKIRE